MYRAHYPMRKQEVNQHPYRGSKYDIPFRIMDKCVWIYHSHHTPAWGLVFSALVRFISTVCVLDQALVSCRSVTMNRRGRTSQVN
jgi:hypothetical protein